MRWVALHIEDAGLANAWGTNQVEADSLRQGKPRDRDFY
jgi:hypothetical protein